MNKFKYKGKLKKCVENRTLFFGDNLEVLREKFPDECVDLIYLDPPFNSNKEYNILFKNGLVENNAQLRAFDDSWHWTAEAERTFEELIGARQSKTKIDAEISDLIQGFEKILGRNDMMAYLVMMAIRLMELYRVLKKTGCIYLHCDPTASHYLKLILDVIFDKRNFVNEIIWAYKTGGASKRHFSHKHDILFLYSKTENYKFNPQKEKSFMMHKYGFKKSDFKIDKETGLQYSMVYMKDVWDIPSVGSADSQRLGYPTQKPERLLERIILASSDRGDLILDPFCGCGTTVSVAEHLDRKWVGIDITTLAINLIKFRLEKQFHFSTKGIKINMDGIPKDLSGAKELALKNRFEFQYWALSLLHAIPSRKKTADEGIDGIIIIRTSEKDYEKVLVQAKSGGVQRKDISALNGDMKREKSIGGVLVTLEEPTKPMKAEASKEGFFKIGVMKEEYPKIQIITIKDLLDHKRLNLPSSYMPYQEAKGIKDLSTKRDNQKNLNHF